MACGGVFLLEKAEAQTKDTTRKHHLEDIEQALYFARNIHGTFPPYSEATWCGRLDSEQAKVSRVHQEIEEALRQQNEKYANPAKPFPTDPSAGAGYFYWKRSPAQFELYAILEADKTGERKTTLCSTHTPAEKYDYGISSIWREYR